MHVGNSKLEMSRAVLSVEVNAHSFQAVLNISWLLAVYQLSSHAHYSESRPVSLVVPLPRANLFSSIKSLLPSFTWKVS